MNVKRTADSAFMLEFQSEQELLEEHRVNLAHGALRLPTADRVAADTPLVVTLRGPWGGAAAVRATVVAPLPDGLALGFEGNPDEILGLLMSGAPGAQEAPGPEAATPEAPEDESPGDAKQTVWDRLRDLPQMQKILLAVKADRTERALLLQDNDPRVLLSLLRNPRLTAEEVARLSRSPFLTYQVADVIMKSSLWMQNLDVRVGLIHNPKTPQGFALRILPSLPDSEVRAVARAGTSMALKTAALRRLQSRT